jgi:hypothetical protein
VPVEHVHRIVGLPVVASPLPERGLVYTRAEAERTRRKAALDLRAVLTVIKNSPATVAVADDARKVKV